MAKSNPTLRRVCIPAWAVREAVLGLYQAAGSEEDADRAGLYRSTAAFLERRLEQALREEET